VTQPTLILGNGPCAQAALTELLDRGARVILATREEALNFIPPDAESYTGEVEWLEQVQLTSCRRSAADGPLILEFSRDGGGLIKQAAEIIIAEECPAVPLFDVYGLAPGKGVLALSAVVETLEKQGLEGLPWNNGDSVVLLNGGHHESHPAITRRVLATALTLQQDHGIQAYVITGNLKVAGTGVERLVHAARQAGVVIARLTGEKPVLAAGHAGTLQVSLPDEVTGDIYRIEARGVVADEEICPDDYLTDLAEILQLERDSDGFLQGGNVHRLPSATNRRDVRVAGPSRGVMSPAAQVADGHIAAAADGLEPAHPHLGLAEIVQGRCVRCLTCYRLCPYQAINLGDNQRVFVAEGQCRQCGICAAECPRGAITLAGLKAGDMAQSLATAAGEDPAAPQVFVFGCSRSAQPAAELARCLGRPLPAAVKLVSVPCAGALSREHIWAAFNQGARGVMVLTCHEGNCHSEQGNCLARQRVDQLKTVLAELGVAPQRLAVHTLAANMGAECAQWVNRFVAELDSGDEI